MHDWSPRDAVRGHVKILLAEDHRDSREALRILLESVGYDVAVAVDGRAAVDLALSEPPDLVLLDIMMPELDGFEVARLLRANQATRKVPIIAVTAMHGAQDLALAAGVDEVISKPIDIHGLLRSVRARLDVSSGN